MSELTPHQQEALTKLNDFSNSDEYQLAMLEGYAGVGKTFLMGEFLKIVSKKQAVCVAAPTHKALKVIRRMLEESGLTFSAPCSDVSSVDYSGGMFAMMSRKAAETGMYAATIHSLLALKLVEKEDGTAECQQDLGKIPSLSDYDLVVIDESSLISRKMFELIAAHKKETKVVFIGDPAQLPPIEDKNQISPVFTHVQYKIPLSEVVRQARDNPIIRLSMSIRDKAQKFAPEDFTAALPTMPSAAGCLIGSEKDLVNFAVAEHKDGRDARVLCYRNKTVMKINRAVHRILHPGTIFSLGEKALVYYAAGFGPGEKSPFKYENGYEHKARLMDEMTVISCDGADSEFDVEMISLKLRTETGYIVTTTMPADVYTYNRLIGQVWNQYRQINARHKSENNADIKHGLLKEKQKLSSKAWAMKKSYPDLRHAYAMTVHRSQGSTFDTVLVHYADINIMKSAFEFNRALYVACTRPRQYLAVVV